MILHEYALVPDIFDATSYTARELARHCLQSLKEPLLNEALVRDLRNGEWSAFMRDGLPRWERAGKELLVKLRRQGRLVVRPPLGAAACSNARTWTQEALASHGSNRLDGIIVPHVLEAEFRGAGPVASIERLSGVGWWRARRRTVETARTISAYRAVLEPFLSHARSIMFIDRFLDPTARGYKDFHNLLRIAAGRNPAPIIELHRVGYLGAGADRRPKDNTFWEETFRSSIGVDVAAYKMSVEVFIWDDFHDRFVISDLAGLTVSNSLDVTADPNATVVWSRLDRDLRDSKQREFDPSSHRHKLQHRFRVP
jgi:hypothetical protein